MGNPPADEKALSMGEFGAAFKGFMETAVAQAPAPEPVFRKLLREHLR